jgi:hypothetical protein
MFMLSDNSAIPQITHGGSGDIIVWSLVLVVSLLVAFAIVAKVKKRLRDDISAAPGAASGFTLADLRQLHRSGQISDEELEKAKAKIIEAAKRASDRDEEERKRKAEGT